VTGSRSVRVGSDNLERPSKAGHDGPISTANLRTHACSYRLT